MWYHFAIKFKQGPELLVQIHDTDLAHDWLCLFHRNYQRELPLLRDLGAYSLPRMKQLVSKCKNILGWNWIHDDYDNIALTTAMHKDLEQYLAKGFHDIPCANDELLHELHICLHAMQETNLRTSIQLEWFNDDGFDLADYDFKFRHEDTLGSILLQNPYVGHPPDWIWQQNDHTNVWQTCRFHDYVRPGFVIKMTGSLEPTICEFDSRAYLDWWTKIAPDFVNYHGIEKMLANTGRPVIGQIINNADLLPLQDMATLSFEYVRFPRDLVLNPVRQNFANFFAINRTDYDNLAGPDWPDYDQFISNTSSFPNVIEEIRIMVGISV